MGRAVCRGGLLLRGTYVKLTWGNGIFAMHFLGFLSRGSFFAIRCTFPIGIHRCYVVKYSLCIAKPKVFHLFPPHNAKTLRRNLCKTYVFLTLLQSPDVVQKHSYVETLRTPYVNLTFLQPHQFFLEKNKLLSFKEYLNES